MRHKIAVTLIALVSVACWAQQEGLGGTGGAGGIAGYQASAPACAITTNGLPDATASSVYSQTLAANTSCLAPLTWSIAFGSLPPGLILNSFLGTITGTPTTPGNYTFTILVTDATTPTAKTATMQLSIAVDCPAISITSTSPLPQALQGSAYSYQFLSLGGLGTVTWGSTGPLPTGLTLASNGVLSGTPTQSGTFTPTITATDSCPITPQSVSQSFTIVVNSPTVITTTSPLPGATESQSYSLQFAATGGTAPYTWTLASGLLPTGMTLTSGGLLSGTPTATVTTTFTVKVADSGTNTNTAQFTITVACTGLTITSSATLPSGTQNVAYSSQLASSGGTGSIFWSLASGTLPNGLTVSSGGLVNGTPTASGTFNPVFQAQDSCAPVPQTASLQATITIGNGLTIATTSPLPNATVGTSYSTQFSASGGTPPYQWFLTQGSLPIGLNLNAAGLLSGTPTQAVAANFTVQVVDSVSTAVSSPFALTSSCVPLVLTSGTTLPVATQGTAYSFQFASTGGFPPLTWQLVGGTLPAGLTLTPAGLLSGTPTATGTFSPVIQIIDSCSPQNQSDQHTFKLVVNTNSGGLTITTASPLPPALVQLPAQADLSWTTAGSGLTYNVYRATVSGGPYTKLNGSPVACCTYNDTTVVIGNTYFYVVRSFDGTQESANSSQVQANIVTYSTQIAVTGGTAPYTYSVSVGTLPTGLTLNTSTGIISGIPTVSNTYNFTIHVVDSAAGSTSKAFTLVVSCGTVTLTSTSPIPNGTINASYSFQFSASGGLLPYTWSLIGGAFPAGLTISSGGLLSGTPTASGSFSPVVQVADSCSPASTASNTFALTINPAPGTLTISTTSPLPGATQGVAYTTQMSATGGTPPYTWSVISGSQPPGITMNSSGVISGTPTIIGTTTATIQVADSASHTASGSFSLTVSCATLAITSPATLPAGTQSSPYSFQMTASGGTGALTWALNTGSFPSGVSISSSGLISGTPSASGSFTPNVKVTDSCSTPQSVNQTESLTISGSPLPLTVATSTPLPAGNINQPYSVTLTATGGTPPYGSWTVTSGSLPTGLSLSSAGVISGTPTVAQTTTPTIQVTDAVPNNASKVFSITINAATAEDNRYCSPAGVWTGPATDGGSNAPTTCVRTALADMPATGPTVTFTAGTACATIQAAINAGSITAGTTFVLPHLNGSSQNSVTCQLKPAAGGSSTNWYYITTDSLSNMPAEGTRITPAWAGLTLIGRPAYLQPGTAGIYIPKLLCSGNFCIQFQATAGFWVVRGLEITSPSGTSASQLIQGIQGWNHVVIVQNVIHGGNSPTGQSKDDIQAGIALNGCQYCGVVDNYIFDTHCGNSCTQSQGIGFGGNGTTVDGPDKAVNNFVESAGENLFSGGGGNVQPTVTQPSANLEIRRNHTFKPLFWKVNDPSYFGTRFELDNCLELKNSQNVWIEGNIFDTSVGFQGSQQGNCIILGPRNQSSQCCAGSASSDGNGTITFISGTNFNNSLVSQFCGVLAGHCLFFYNGLYYQVASFISSTQITLQLCSGTNGTCANSHGGSPGLTLPPVTASAAFLGFAPGLNPNAVNNDIVVRYNQITHAARVGAIAYSPSDGGDFPKSLLRTSWHDNTADDINGFKWSITAGGCCVWSTGLQISGNASFPSGYVINHNTFIEFLTAGTGANPGTGPSFGFGGGTNDHLGPGQIINNISAAGFGCCIGTAKALWTQWVTKAGLCFDHNFLVVATNPLGPNGSGNFKTGDNPPYPAPSDQGGCPFTPTGTTQPATYTAMQFTNLNGGVGGNYTLLGTSPGHNAASDGLDVGANIQLVNQFTAGVQ